MPVANVPHLLRSFFRLAGLPVVQFAPPSSPAPQFRQDNSPGRKPGARPESSAEPWGDKKGLRTKLFRPCQGSINTISYPGARAPGYYLSAPPGLGRHILQPDLAAETISGARTAHSATESCGRNYLSAIRDIWRKGDIPHFPAWYSNGHGKLEKRNVSFTSFRCRSSGPAW